jgi:hypothetical protein
MLVLFLGISNNSFASDTLYVWFGNIDRSPITVSPDQSPVYITVYAKTSDNAYVANMHLPLAVQDIYINSIPVSACGDNFYPINLWDDHSFISTFDGAPPNNSGWHSRSFLGFADIGGQPNPLFHSSVPVQILRFAITPVWDTSLVGDTVYCLQSGISARIGNPGAGDSIGGNYIIVTYYSPLLFVGGGCRYFPGDINGDGSRIGGDVNYGVRYFKNLGIPPKDSCYLDSAQNYLYVSGDCNGDCQFRGSDLTRLVSYFKGISPIGYCHFFPPLAK